jgi:hypothetical protein
MLVEKIVTVLVDAENPIKLSRELDPEGYLVIV